jgi:Fe2+ or Zn2+ uptake regulation protein
MREYYNTNRESGETLVASERQARNQRLSILAFFEQHPGSLFAPHQVQQRVLPTAPLTSVRRAMTNLTDEGHLEKTREMEYGTYGKQVHRWRLRSPQNEGYLF